MKKIIIALFLAFITFITHAADSLIVAHWPMNDNIDTIVTDLVGNNNGALVGLDPVSAWIPGGGINFDNTNGHHIEIPHASVFDFAEGSFTLSLLVRYVAPPVDTDRWIIKGTHSSPGSGSRYEVFCTGGGTVRFSIDNGTADIKTKLEVPDDAFITGDWVHVLAIRDTANGKILLYANGDLQGSETDNSGDISNGEPLFIGESTDETGTAMSGDMRDIRLYNYALGSQQIDTLFGSYNIASSNAYLSSIVLEPAADLDPAFRPGVYNYSALLPEGTDSVAIRVQPADENATISGDSIIDLSTGSAVALVNVLAGNGITSNTYRINLSTELPGPPTLAFPGADGYGKYVSGGRGGTVYEVTSLNDDNLPGSLRWAVNQNGPRTIVFSVSGNINLKSRLTINKGDITIAGQTAPGEGICLINNSVKISANNVIIRYLRFRLGERWGDDALSGGSPKNSAGSGSLPMKNIMIDHCSVSYGCDETLSIYDVENLTIQWCIISESMNRDSHGYGGIMGGWGASLHHSLFAHHKNRSPRFCGARYQFNLERELFDMRYNVIYNGGKSYGGEGGHYNLVNNYYKKINAEFCNPSKPNPSETDNEFVGLVYDSIKSYWYIEGNFVHGNSGVSANNWSGGVRFSDPAHNIKANSPFESLYSGAEETAQEAYSNVLSGAGAILPERDTVDKIVIMEVRNNTGQLKLTLADIPGEPFPALNSEEAPLDSDHDGMPNEWENKMSLNPEDPSDGNLLNSNGYTMLEIYLNSIEFTLKVEGINVTKNLENHLKITWAETFLAESGYIIERADENGEFEVIDSVAKNVNTYTDLSVSTDNQYFYRVKAWNSYNESLYSDIATYSTVSVSDLIGSMSNIEIYPNPVSEHAFFRFKLTESSEVEITIHDINGKLVHNLSRNYYDPGNHTVVWDVRNTNMHITPGIYICTLRTFSGIKTQRFAITKN